MTVPRINAPISLTFNLGKGREISPTCRKYGITYRLTHARLAHNGGIIATYELM